jgi:hypothetical protein
MPSKSNDFKTFKEQFPKTVEMLKDIIDKEPLEGVVNLEKIFTMVATGDEKIRDELIAAEYFVKTLKAIGVTKEMVLSLEKEMPNIMIQTNKMVSQLQLQKDDTTTKINGQSASNASKNKTGGQPARFLTICILFLLLIVNYLLHQIQISPDDLDRIQNTIIAQRTRMQQEVNSNCMIPQSFSIAPELRVSLENFMCGFRNNHIDALTSMLNFILEYGLSAHDLLSWPVGRGPLLITASTIPMMTFIVTIISIMNVGAGAVIGFYSYSSPAGGIDGDAAAATTLQAFTRGMFTRRKANQKSAAANKIQKWWTGRRDGSSGGSRRRRCSKRCKRHHRTQTKR